MAEGFLKKRKEMRSKFLGYACACLSIFIMGCQGNAPTQKGIDYDEFKNPSKEYRATLFYSLNDSLYPDVIRQQIKDFAESGIGGVFFHAREGLLTQYFDKDWWAAIDAGVDQCLKSGINPWFYDEYKWPSGYAAGYVPRLSKDYRGHSLVRMNKGENIPTDGVLINSDESYQYVCVTTPLGNSWLNGSCKVDYFNPEAIEAFINHTYKTYAQRNAEKYNNAVKGIFFDEPDIRPSYDKSYEGIIGYSPALRETFLHEKGYDIADHFASLFEEVGDFRKIRLDYWQIAGMQYEKAFAGQLGKFCRENQLILTGHFFPEETLGGCQQGIGNLMRQLRNEGMPGMDHLELRVDGGLNVAKSVSSVANQYGKERRMSELFGVSGQNMNFEDQKWIANWHTVLGVNFFVEHLALYSMRGERKRDYPPALSYQQPWWQQNRYIQDYMGRLCYLSTIGQYAAKTLLMVPLESMYVAVRDERSMLEDTYYTAVENLMKVHCDFDLGDELIMEEIGSTDKGVMRVGEMEYNTVIIPPSLTLRETTVRTLLGFASQGGKLLILDSYPRYVDAEEDKVLLDQLKQVSTLISNTAEDFKRYLEVLPVVADDDAEIYTQKRVVNDGSLYMFTNISRKKGKQILFKLGKEERNPVIWDPFTAKTYKVEADKDGSVLLELAPADFMVLTTGSLSDGVPIASTYQVRGACHPLMTLDQHWTGHKLDPNAITLDFASYSLDGKNYSQPEPLIAIMRRMSERAKNSPLFLRIEVDVEDVPASCALVAEHPEMYKRIYVNGKEIDGFGNAYYRDVFFKTSSDIAPSLKNGKNVIDIALDFVAPLPSDTIFAHRYGTELESFYLIGDFAVRADTQRPMLWNTEKNLTNTFIPKPVHVLNDFTIVKESTAFTGDVTAEGYPFYAGKFMLHNTFTLPAKEKGCTYYLEMPLSEAIVYELEINGQELEACIASPYAWDITEYIKEGNNEVTFTLTNSLRNLLGPHHHKGGELKGTSALSFVGTGGWPNAIGDRDWYDLRLDKKNTLRVWTDDYNVIPFGFIEPVRICVHNNIGN